MTPIYEIIDTVSELLRGEGLQEWGAWIYPIFTALVIIEGRIVTLLAAVASSAGYMRLPLVMVCAVVGGLVADSLWYLLGYRFGEEHILRYGRWLGLRRCHLEQVLTGIQERGPMVLTVAKFSSVLVIPALVAAGVARVPFRRWFPIVLLGELLWVTALAVIGFQTAEVVRRVEMGLQYLPVAGLGLALLALMLIVGRRLSAGLFREGDAKSARFAGRERLARLLDDYCAYLMVASPPVYQW